MFCVSKKFLRLLALVLFFGNTLLRGEGDSQNLSKAANALSGIGQNYQAAMQAAREAQAAALDQAATQLEQTAQELEPVAPEAAEQQRQAADKLRQQAQELRNQAGKYGDGAQESGNAADGNQTRANKVADQGSPAEQGHQMQSEPQQNMGEAQKQTAEVKADPSQEGLKGNNTDAYKEAYNKNGGNIRTNDPVMKETTYNGQPYNEALSAEKGAHTWGTNENGFTFHDADAAMNGQPGTFEPANTSVGHNMFSTESAANASQANQFGQGAVMDHYSQASGTSPGNGSSPSSSGSGTPSSAPAENAAPSSSPAQTRSASQSPQTQAAQNPANAAIDQEMGRIVQDSAGKVWESNQAGGADIRNAAVTEIQKGNFAPVYGSDPGAITNPAAANAYYNSQMQPIISTSQGFQSFGAYMATHPSLFTPLLVP